MLGVPAPAVVLSPLPRCSHGPARSRDGASVAASVVWSLIWRVTVVGLAVVGAPPSRLVARRCLVGLPWAAVPLVQLVVASGRCRCRLWVVVVLCRLVLRIAAGWLGCARGYYCLLCSVAGVHWCGWRGLCSSVLACGGAALGVLLMLVAGGRCGGAAQVSMRPLWLEWWHTVRVWVRGLERMLRAMDLLLFSLCIT